MPFLGLTVTLILGAGEYVADAEALLKTGAEAMKHVMKRVLAHVVERVIERVGRRVGRVESRVLVGCSVGCLIDWPNWLCERWITRVVIESRRER